MPAETLNQLGFVKIPESVQRHMGLRPGDKIDIRILADGRVMMVKAGVVWSTDALVPGAPSRTGGRPVTPHNKEVVFKDVYFFRGDIDPHHVSRFDVPVKDDKGDFEWNDDKNDPANHR